MRAAKKEAQTATAMSRVALAAKLSFIRLKWASGVTVLSVPAINAAKIAALRTDVFFICGMYLKRQIVS